MSYFNENANGTPNLSVLIWTKNISIGEPNPTAQFTVNTVAAFGEGNVTNPSVAYRKNLSTGMWFPQNNTIAFSTGGNERIRIDSSGNVGIGVASPKSILDINGIVSINGSANITNQLISNNIVTNTFTANTFTAADVSSNNTSVNTFSVITIVSNTISSNVITSNTISSDVITSNTISSNVISSNKITSTNVVANTVVVGSSKPVSIASNGIIYATTVYSTAVGGTNQAVYVDNTGLIGYLSSLRTSKMNIENLNDISWLYKLNPISFNYRKKNNEEKYTDIPDGDVQYGMIAEEVEAIRQDLCSYANVNGKPELQGIQYNKLIPILLKAIQDLRAEFDEYKKTHQ